MTKTWPVVCLLLAACGPNVPSQNGGSTAIAGGLTLNDLPVAMDPPIAGTFAQQIDHPTTGASTLGTFQQRYWYSTQFASGPTSPVIFYFCGEAPCDPAYALTMADSAKSLGAAVVVLEHRYYGSSVPYPDESLAHMQYLTVHNALEDAATFELWAKANLPVAGKWIAVGGSYPGMLAAFYREQHPELVVGAWASSAPVNVQLSFTGYDQIAAKALGPTCTKLFDKVLATFDTAFKNPTTASAQLLQQEFYGGPFPTNEADLMNGISGIAESDAQYGQESQLCAALQQNEKNPVQGLVDYYYPPLVPDPDMGNDGGPSDLGFSGDFAFNSDGGIDAGNDAGYDAGNSDGGFADSGSPSTLKPSPVGRHAAGLLPKLGFATMRAPDNAISFQGAEWFYQVCTELGFFQVHNTGTGGSIVSPLVDAAYWQAQCTTYIPGTTPAVAATNATYYQPLTQGKVSNVLFVNGSVDPWSALSLNKPSEAPKGITEVVVATGSHCSDLDNLTQYDTDGVFIAHKTFHDLAVGWLAQ